MLQVHMDISRRLKGTCQKTFAYIVDFRWKNVPSLRTVAIQVTFSRKRLNFLFH